MLMNFDLFDFLFPTYYSYKTPMWYSVRCKDGYELELAVPGYDKEDFRLYTEGDTLVLDIIKDGEVYIHYSILGRYSGGNYSLDKAEATYKSGILKITVPKSQKALAKHEIKVS